MYKTITIATLIAAASIALPAQAADIAAGKIKAAASCTGCHGDDHTSGMFPLVQLGGRNADKLTVKTNKFRTGKLFSPLMTMSVMNMTDADVADIAAYYQSLGKPAWGAPMIQVRGDEEQTASAGSSTEKLAARY